MEEPAIVKNVICLHAEDMNPSSHVGTCRICGQQRRYDPDDPKEIRLVKRGRIKGILTEVDPPQQSAITTEKSVSIKKEVIVKEQEVAEKTGQVPEKPKKRKLLWKYYDEHKEAILADYQSMPLVKFFERWSIWSSTWDRLKERWQFEGKGKGSGQRKGRRTDIKPPKSPKTDESQVVELTERERYLVLLGYQQAVREILK